MVSNLEVAVMMCEEPAVREVYRYNVESDADAILVGVETEADRAGGVPGWQCDKCPLLFGYSSKRCSREQSKSECVRQVHIRENVHDRRLHSEASTSSSNRSSDVSQDKHQAKLWRISDGKTTGASLRCNHDPSSASFFTC
jgi:hypothetical protein